MFTRKYCNKIQSKSESRLNPIEVFMKDLLLNVGYYNDTFLNSKNKKESIQVLIAQVYQDLVIVINTKQLLQDLHKKI